MIGRRVAVALSLVCSLLICAITAQSALGAAATNTTAVTCTEGAVVKDFSDAHCDNKVQSGGKFGHTGIANGVKTEVSVTNTKTKNNTTEATPAIFKFTSFGVKHEVTCTVVSGTGTLENTEPSANKHQVKGTITAELDKCTVNKPAGFGCEVKQPIKVTSNVEGVEGLGALKNEMGLEFKPAPIEIVIANCLFSAVVEITGTAIGTGTPPPTAKHSGATNVFTNAMTKETLVYGGNPAEISSSTTVTTKTGGSPVALTTAT